MIYYTSQANANKQFSTKTKLFRHVLIQFRVNGKHVTKLPNNAVISLMNNKNFIYYKSYRIYLSIQNIYKEKCFAFGMCLSILHLSKQKYLSLVMIHDLQTAAKANVDESSADFNLQSTSSNRLQLPRRTRNVKKKKISQRKREMCAYVRLSELMHDSFTKG